MQKKIYFFIGILIMLVGTLIFVVASGPSANKYYNNETETISISNFPVQNINISTNETHMFLYNDYLNISMEHIDFFLPEELQDDIGYVTPCDTINGFYCQGNYTDPIYGQDKLFHIKTDPNAGDERFYMLTDYIFNYAQYDPDGDIPEGFNWKRINQEVSMNYRENNQNTALFYDWNSSQDINISAYADGYNVIIKWDFYNNGILTGSFNKTIRGSEAEYTLKENTLFCNKNCYAEGEVYFKESTQLFEDIYFFDTLGNQTSINSNRFLYRENSSIDWTIYSGENLSGNYLWRLEGTKNSEDSVDWVVKAIGFLFEEWKWWNSWQDWNDDFEDASIDTTLWDTDNRVRIAFGGSPRIGDKYEVDEISLFGDGALRINNRYGTDDVVNKYTSFITKQDFNDGKDYNISFSLNGTNAGANEAGARGTQIRIINITSLSLGTSGSWDLNINNPSDSLRILSNTEIQDNIQHYTLTIKAETNNFSLYNASSGYLLNSTIITMNNWYLMFEMSGWKNGGGYTDSYLNVYNFTTLADLSISTSLISPSNSATINDNKTTFTAQFNMSQATHNVSNATFYLWYSNDTLLYNSSSIDLGSDLANDEANLEYNFTNYGTYKWNWQGFGTDGASLTSDYADSNFTITMADNVSPEIAINSPSSSVSSATITINTTIYEQGDLDICYYNITRGASLEVANTNLNISTYPYLNDSVTLSSEASYVLNVFCNDSIGNENTTNLSFTYSVAPIVVDGVGGGGGGSASLDEEEIYVSGQVCMPFKIKFQESYSMLDSVEGDLFDKAKYLWKSFWDYALCSGSAATIVPI